jgi:flagellar assembly factor FliW
VHRGNGRRTASRSVRPQFASARNARECGYGNHNFAIWQPSSFAGRRPDVRAGHDRAAQNPALGWLQSLDDPEVALGVVSPRRFVADYQLRVSRQELASLALANTRDAQVVVVVSRHAEGLSLNLRAPLVINVESRRGRQVIAKDPLPVRLVLPLGVEMRRTA